MSSQFSLSAPLFEFAKKLRESIRFDAVTNAESKAKWTAEIELLETTYHHHLGECCLHTNDGRGSETNFGTCVEKLRHLLDDEAKRNDSFFGVALNELGCAYLQNWKEEEALAAFEESLSVLENLKDSTKQLITMPQINLGFAYGLAGRFEDASSTFESALKDRFAELGQDDATSFV
jgi:tetratricopeptide (TPR) repeat protein